MKTKLLILSLIASLFVLPACSSTFKKGSNSAQNAPSLSPLEDQLAVSAQSVAGSLRTLAKTQQTRDLVAVLDTAPLITAEGGMGGTVMLDWAGPLEPLLQKVAQLTDYQVKVLGTAPTIPVLVSLLGEERVVADLLKDAALQAGNQANIVVYPSLKIIEVRYL